MLNKELLMVGEVGPHMLLILNNEQGFIDPDGNTCYGYMQSYAPDAMGPSIGNVNRIPYWGSPDISFLQALCSSLDDGGGNYITSLRFRGRIPFVPMSVTIKDRTSKERTSKFSNAYHTWLHGEREDVWDLERSGGMTLPVYFDPPPDGYLDPKTLEPI